MVLFWVDLFIFNFCFCICLFSWFVCFFLFFYCRVTFSLLDFASFTPNGWERSLHNFSPDSLKEDPEPPISPGWACFGISFFVLTCPALLGGFFIGRPLLRVGPNPLEFTLTKMHASYAWTAWTWIFRLADTSFPQVFTVYFIWIALFTNCDGSAR